MLIQRWPARCLSRAKVVRRGHCKPAGRRYVVHSGPTLGKLKKEGIEAVAMKGRLYVVRNSPKAEILCRNVKETQESHH
jgi:hypothetical protein